MSNEATADDVHVAETYYDSPDADQFYSLIWGGEDIHIGLYRRDGDSIAEASQRTIERMAERLGVLPAGVRVLDLGSGYGGSARWLAREKGAHVTCVNISEAQNAANRLKNAEQGVADKVTVLHGSFDAPPVEPGAFDVVWSQDAFLHGADRARIISAAAAALKPGGRVIFTDPMQSASAAPDALEPILARIHLPSLGSVAFYQDVAKEVGLVDEGFEDHSIDLRRHYAAVRDQLAARRSDLRGMISSEYIDRMIVGLTHWVDGQARGDLTWGILLFSKPAVA